jgi:hypothetical protein
VAPVVPPARLALFSREDLRGRKSQQCLMLLWQEYGDG